MKSILMISFLLLAVFSCTVDDNTVLSEEEASQIVTDIIYYISPGPLETGDRAPNFVMNPGTDLEKQLRDLRGNIVLLDFALNGCVNCTLAEPNIKQVYKDNSQGNFKLIKIHSQYLREEFMKNVEEAPGLIHVWEPGFAEHKLSALYDVRGYPTAIIIDELGYIREYVSPLNPNLSEKIANYIENINP